MNYYDGYDKGCFPCGESCFDKQQFSSCGTPYGGKPHSNISCCFDKKFLMECELKCKPYRPKPVCQPKPCFLPFWGCLCAKPPRRDC